MGKAAALEHAITKPASASASLDVVGMPVQRRSATQHVLLMENATGRAKLVNVKKDGLEPAATKQPAARHALQKRALANVTSQLGSASVMACTKARTAH